MSSAAERWAERAEPPHVLLQRVRSVKREAGATRRDAARRGADWPDEGREPQVWTACRWAARQELSAVLGEKKPSTTASTDSWRCDPLPAVQKSHFLNTLRATAADAHLIVLMEKKRKGVWLSWASTVEKYHQFRSRSRIKCDVSEFDGKPDYLL